MPLIKNPSNTAVAAPVAPDVDKETIAPPTKRTLGKAPKAGDVLVPYVPERVVESEAKTTAKSLQPKGLDDKSKQIQKQGLWQAAVQSTSLVQYAPTIDAYLDLVDKVADRGLKYVNSER